MLQAAGMAPPLIAKPWWTDGRDASHGLAVVHDLAGLSQLLRRDGACNMRLPLVLQQFSAHGGCLFKVRVGNEMVNRTTHARRAYACMALQLRAAAECQLA